MKKTKLFLMAMKSGWAIARMTPDGPEQLSWPFDCMEKAQEFCAIANYDLRFIPSALPHIHKRLAEGG